MSEIQNQLKEHLKNAKDWDKMETPIEGVTIVKVPGTKSRPALLFLEVNPLNEDGSPMKKRGLFVSNKEMLLKFSETLNDDKTFQLIGEIEKVNPPITSQKPKKLKM